MTKKIKKERKKNKTTTRNPHHHLQQQQQQQKVRIDILPKLTLGNVTILDSFDSFTALKEMILKSSFCFQ